MTALPLSFQKFIVLFFFKIYPNFEDNLNNFYNDRFPTWGNPQKSHSCQLLCFEIYTPLHISFHHQQRIPLLCLLNVFFSHCLKNKNKQSRTSTWDEIWIFLCFSPTQILLRLLKIRSLHLKMPEKPKDKIA